MERAQARRFGLVVAFGMLVIGLVASTTLYIRARHAQERTAIAAAQSKAVTDFLSKDVFAPVSSGTESVKGMTVLELLRRTGDEIDERFAGQPDVASELHFVIGRSFQAFLDASLAVKHFRRALELGENLSGQGSQAAMRSASELIQIDYFLGQLQDTIERYVTVLEAGEKRVGRNAPEVLDLRLNLARGRYLLGDWNSASRMFQELLTDAASPETRSELIGRTEFHYGQLLTDLARPVEAEHYLRAAIAQLRSALGEKHLMVAEARSALGRALADAGRFSEASNELEKAHELALQWAPLESWTEVRPRFFTALLLLHQDQPAKAEPLLADIVRYEDVNEAAYLEAHKDSTPELDHTGPVRQALGEAYAREGKLTEAVETLQRAVAVSERASGAKHPWVLSAKLSLAEALIADRRSDDARHLAASIRPEEVTALPATHPILAQWYRVNGLLDLNDNHIADAHGLLTRALGLYEVVYGPKDWRSVRAQQDLQLTSSTGSGQ
jgi:non-specific serine/threonine protein kinase